MSEQSQDNPSNEILRQLDGHLKMLRGRTALSAVCFAAFLVVSVLVVMSGRPLILEDGYTLISLGCIVAAFLLLPRNYTPTALLSKATGEEAEYRIEQIRRYQRYGLFQRITYIVLAVVVILGIPWLRNRTGT